MNDEANGIFVVGFGLGIAFTFIVLIILAEVAITDFDRNFYAIKERIETECVIHEYQDTTKIDDKFIITFTCK